MSHGLYVPETPPRSLVDDLRAWSLVVPSTAAFTHLTAAELNGWWLPMPHPIPHLPLCGGPIRGRDGAACTSAATRIPIR